jgi:amino acid transporter
MYFFDGMGLPGNILVPIIGIMFLYTLFVNLLSWAMGVNYVACYAAENKALPGFFAKRSKSGAPFGPAIINGVVASLMLIAVPFIPNQDIFWGFFALQIITLLMSYMVMFPAFKKLRQIDPDRERPYRVPGGPAAINFVTYAPVLLLILATVFCIAYPDDGGIIFDEMLVIGTFCAIIAGEAITYLMCRKGGQL